MLKHSTGSSKSQVKDCGQSKGSSGGATATSVSTSSEPTHKTMHGFSRMVYTSRLSFVLCLCTVAALMGYGAHRILTKSEERMAEEHFKGLAERALQEALQITLRKRRGAKTIASLASYTFPDARTWPNVSIFGFEGIAKSVMETAEAVTMGLCPLVRPEELSEFEDFAYNQAFAEVNGHYPNTTGLHDYGNGLTKGVRGYNTTFYRETDGKTHYNSSYDIITPFIMHSAGPEGLLMFNLHSMQQFGGIIDKLLNCVAASSGSTDKIDPMMNTSYLDKCAILSDMIIMYTDDHGTQSGPSAYIMQPVYPAKNNSVVTGFVTSAIRWLDVLERLFSTEVSGVDCVLETETQAYTYSVDHGMATFKREGHAYDLSYARYGQSIELFSPGVFAHSARYTLTIYPNEALFGVFGTNNPTKGLIGALCIMFFTSCIFILYDHFVQKDLYRKEAITEARRLFVRFISHEVRTPINTVCIGASLIQETLSKFTNECKAPFTSGKSATTEQDKKERLMEQLRDWSDLVSDVLVNANCAVNVLGDLLNYDKVESGTLPLELSIIQIWPLVQRAGAEFRLAAVAKNMRYEIDYSKSIHVDKGKEEEDIHLLRSRRTSRTGKVNEVGVEDCETPRLSSLPVDTRMQHVVGDPVRISQIIRSFISNAFEFTENGGKLISSSTFCV